MCPSGGGTAIALSSVKSHDQRCSPSKGGPSGVGGPRPAAVAIGEDVKGPRLQWPDIYFLQAVCLRQVTSLLSQLVHVPVCKMGIICPGNCAGENTLEMVGF